MIKTKINIGSGARPMAKSDNEWEDLDLRAGINPTIIADCRSIPRPDNTYSYALVHSVLEHFGKRERFDCLKEWYRILKQDGIIYISVPDMEAIGKELVRNPKHQLINLIYGEQNYLENQHKWGYYKKSIKEDLESVGFRNIVFKKSSRYKCELVLEAQK